MIVQFKLINKYNTRSLNCFSFFDDKVKDASSMGPILFDLKLSIFCLSEATQRTDVVTQMIKKQDLTVIQK